MQNKRNTVSRSETLRRVVLLLIWMAWIVPRAGSQETIERRPMAQEMIHRLPEAYRREAQILEVTTGIEEYLRAASDDYLASWVIAALARKPEGQAFLLAQLEREGSPELRISIITWMLNYWAKHPEGEKILEQHLSNDAAPEVSVCALEMLRRIRMSALGELLSRRIEGAARSGDINARKRLGDEEELWYSVQNEILLPGFLRRPPAEFNVVPRGRPIRVLAFGDFGTGSSEQQGLAAAMARYHLSHPFQFGLTLGDNFYSEGVSSLDDPQWKTKWENLYTPLGIQFYATLGNHDWEQSDSPAAEILYSARSRSWRMPAPYYTFTAGAAQFFAIDTQELNEAELLWLDGELTKSQATWKIVYGHFHIYSATRGDNKELIERLLPILKKNAVDVYLNGHDHNMQEVKPDGSVHFFVSGGGGAGLYDLNPYDRYLYKEKVNGFTVLEADAKHLKVSFIGIDGKELHSDTLEK